MTCPHSDTWAHTLMLEEQHDTCAHTLIAWSEVERTRRLALLHVPPFPLLPSSTHARTHAHTHTHTHARAHTHTHTHAHAHTHTHAHAHAHAHAYAHACAYTHTHTQTHTIRSGARERETERRADIRMKQRGSLENNPKGPTQRGGGARSGGQTRKRVCVFWGEKETRVRAHTQCQR